MIQELKPYEALRPSGDPWLGWVPKHWSQKRLWSISSPRIERNPGNLPLYRVYHLEAIAGRVRGSAGSGVLAS